MCFLLCLAFVWTDKLLTYLRSVLLLWGREAQRYHRAHTAGSHWQDGPAGYLPEHQQNTSDSHPPGTSWSYTTLWEGWTNGPPSWTSTRPLYQGKTFSIWHVRSQSTEGTAVLNFLNSYLFAAQHLWEEPNYSCYQANTEHRCWTSQIGSGSFSYSSLKTNSSTFPKPNSTHYSNMGMIVLLQFCSENLKHVHNEESDLGLDLRAQASFTPLVFFSFLTLTDIQVPYSTKQNIHDMKIFNKAWAYLTPKALLPASKEFTASQSRQEITRRVILWRGGRPEYQNNWKRWQLYSVCWLTLPQCSVFSTIYITCLNNCGVCLLVFKYPGYSDRYFNFYSILWKKKKKAFHPLRQRQETIILASVTAPITPSETNTHCPASLVMYLTLHSWNTLKSGNGSILETDHVNQEQRTAPNFNLV